MQRQRTEYKLKVAVYVKDRRTKIFSIPVGDGLRIGSGTQNTIVIPSLNFDSREFIFSQKYKFYLRFFSEISGKMDVGKGEFESFENLFFEQGIVEGESMLLKPKFKGKFTFGNHQILFKMQQEQKRNILSNQNKRRKRNVTKPIDESFALPMDPQANDDLSIFLTEIGRAALLPIFSEAGITLSALQNGDVDSDALRKIGIDSFIDRRVILRQAASIGESIPQHSSVRSESLFKKNRPIDDSQKNVVRAKGTDLNIEKNTEAFDISKEPQQAPEEIILSQVTSDNAIVLEKNKDQQVVQHLAVDVKGPMKESTEVSTSSVSEVTFEKDTPNPGQQVANSSSLERRKTSRNVISPAEEMVHSKSQKDEIDFESDIINTTLNSALANHFPQWDLKPPSKLIKRKKSKTL